MEGFVKKEKPQKKVSPAMKAPEAEPGLATTSNPDGQVQGRRRALSAGRVQERAVSLIHEALPLRLIETLATERSKRSRQSRHPALLPVPPRREMRVGTPLVTYQTSKRRSKPFTRPRVWGRSSLAEMSAVTASAERRRAWECVTCGTVAVILGFCPAEALAPT